MKNLIIHSVANLREKRELLSRLNPREMTWLVPDMDSKTQVQKLLLNHCDVLEEGAVLRVSEFWGEILVRVHPEFQVVSRSVCLALISQWLEEWDVDWAKAPGSPTQAMAFMDQLLPILGHPSGHEIISEWWMENESSLVRWGGWYQLCRQLWELMKEQKIIPASWVPGLLVNEESLAGVWDKPLWVDLGSGLGAVEADVFLLLKETCSINILQPKSEWSSSYNTTLWPYNLMTGTVSQQQIRTENLTDWKAMPQVLRSDPAKFKKFTTMLSEVKSTIGQVRQWIDAGIVPSKIAILAPDIETYWSALYAYCVKEGVPVAKKQVTNLVSYPELACWFASLKINMGKVSYTDLELHLYSDKENPFTMKYHKFQSTYSTILDKRDLRRDAAVGARSKPESTPAEHLGLEDFLVYALKSWTASPADEGLHLLLSQLYQNCPPGMALSYSAWVRFIESTAAKTEKLTEEANLEGIVCQNINSSQWLTVSHVCVVGLTEAALKNRDVTGISMSEVLRLSQQAGFHLTSADSSQIEFELNWLLENEYEEVLLSSPVTDFAGGIEAPALIWLRSRWELKVLPEAMDQPLDTRWDEIQRSSGSAIGDFVLADKVDEDLSADKRRLVQSIGEDLDQIPKSKFGTEANLSVSVTQLEKYERCPFIYTAEKLFHLKDLPLVDLDMDRMSQGQFMHKLFENLVLHFFPKENNKLGEEFKPEEVAKVVADSLDSLELSFGDDRLRSSLLFRYTELAKNFLKFEKNWRQEFPHMSTVETELKIQGYWDVEQACLAMDKSSGIAFRGSIDRVDQDENNNYVFIDYKSSEGQVTHFGSWLRSNSYQMPLYAQAIQNGLTGLSTGAVVGGIYYVSRTLNRSKGFKVLAKAEALLQQEGQKLDKGWGAQEDIDAVFAKVNTQIQSHILNMKQGCFQPNPNETQRKNCKSCRWRSLCRSPHLN